MTLLTRSAFLLLLLALAVSPLAAQIPDTYVATGAISNIAAPYNPAPFGAYGTLVTSSSAEMPVFVGARYELYRDQSGKPAYGGLATAKIVLWRKGRFFLFGDTSIGAAATVNNISSAFNVGGGGGIVLSKSNTPHWEIEFEPRAQRIPALQNGTSSALLVAMSYTFNRPK